MATRNVQDVAIIPLTLCLYCIKYFKYLYPQQFQSAFSLQGNWTSDLIRNLAFFPPELVVFDTVVHEAW